MEDFAFIGQEDEFEPLGFKRNEWFDFDTHKFVQFEKKIGEEDSAIEVCFTYETKEGEENYEFQEGLCELRVGGETVPIKAKSIEELIELHKILTGE